MENEKEYYAEVVTNKDEERIAKNSNKKVLVIVMRCLFGQLGIDKFIMHKNRKAVQTLITTIIILSLNLVGLLLLLIPLFGWMIYLGLVTVTIIILTVRQFYFLATGLKYVHLQPQEVAYIYEDL